jgi:hypothetical protein
MPEHDSLEDPGADLDRGMPPADAIGIDGPFEAGAAVKARAAGRPLRQACVDRRAAPLGFGLNGDVAVAPDREILAEPDRD